MREIKPLNGVFCELDSDLKYFFVILFLCGQFRNAFRNILRTLSALDSFSIDLKSDFQ